MGAFGGPNIVEDGLVFSADAGNAQCYTSGSATATNLIGGLTLTLENGSGTVIQPSDNSWDFDGSDDYIDCGSSFYFTTGLSICFFMKMTITDTSQTIISKYASRNYGIWYNGDLNFHLKTTSWTGINVGSYQDTYTNGTWNHIACTWDGSNRYIYVNGEQKANGSLSGTIEDNATYNVKSTRLALLEGAAGYGFDGGLGCVLFYNRGITSSEILQNYNSQKARFGL
jgi:hypothetical protein